MWPWMPTAYPPISRYSTRFELSDFKNSLKSFGSAGIAIEGSAEKFESLQAFDGRTGEPVGNRVVRVGEADYGEVGSVQPKLTGRFFVCQAHPS